MMGPGRLGDVRQDAGRRARGPKKFPDSTVCATVRLLRLAIGGSAHSRPITNRPGNPSGFSCRGGGPLGDRPGRRAIAATSRRHQDLNAIPMPGSTQREVSGLSGVRAAGWAAGRRVGKACRQGTGARPLGGFAFRVRCAGESGASARPGRAGGGAPCAPRRRGASRAKPRSGPEAVPHRPCRSGLRRSGRRQSGRARPRATRVRARRRPAWP